MIESTCCRTRQPLSIDLLPWADPYIIQLFQESPFRGDSHSVETAPDMPPPRDGRRACSLADAPQRRDAAPLSRRRQRLGTRTQRTESERWLARC